MNDKPIPRRLTRRDFLRMGGGGALSLLAGGTLISSAVRHTDRALAAAANPSAGLMPAAAPASPTADAFARLVATDGFMKLPGREDDPLYVFGFVHVPVGASIDSLDVWKGNVQQPSPIISVAEETDLYLTLTNIGLVVRPDLDDSHTIHWHGFRNPVALFDGVPEVSIAVPVSRDFPYFYRPHDEGTYMYHCHFEDTEHVQMQMDGIVFVRPLQNGTSIEYPTSSGKFYDQFAYDDGDGSTGYDREFGLLLNEIDTRPHDLLRDVQEFIWSEYKPSYWIMNGRCYPDTLLPNNDPSMPNQPLSSLIQVKADDRVLLRLVNLGYEQQSMQLTGGIRLKVVGHDASFLRGPAPHFADLSYETNTIYIGPGEARDVLFTAPPYDVSRKVTDAVGDHNVYWLRNRNAHRLTNGGAPGLGGQVTQVRVYEKTNPLIGAQTHPHETYPEFSPPTLPAGAPHFYLDPWIVLP